MKKIIIYFMIIVMLIAGIIDTANYNFKSALYWFACALVNFSVIL